MQQRFRVASTDEFGEAVTVRNTLQEKFPDKKFQIRKTHKGFKIVERVPAGEQDFLKTNGPKRRKGKRRGIIDQYELR